MDAITKQEFTSRLVQLCVSSGLRGIPRKIRDRHILLKSITLTPELNNEYAEHELNDNLRAWLREVGMSIRRLDHVNLRRLLVDQEYVGRSKDGSRYWVAVCSRYKALFTPDVDGVDVRSLIRAARDEQELRKQHFLELGREV